MHQAELIKLATRSKPLESMSEEEYTEFDKAFSDTGDQAEQRAWSYESNDERLSLLLGLVAGLAMVAIMVLIFF